MKSLFPLVYALFISTILVFSDEPSSFLKEVHFSQSHKVVAIHSPGEELNFNPSAILSKPGEALYVADSKKNKVFKIQHNGELLGQLNPKSGLRNPTALVLLPQGEIAVLDGASHRIVLFDSFEEEISLISEPGTSKTQLMYPRDMIFDYRTNSFLIADYGNLRVLELDRKGKFRGVFLYLNETNSEKGAPISLALVEENLFVLYPDYKELVIFNRYTGDLKKVISNSTLDQKLLLDPQSIASGPGGFAFLSDSLLRAILVFDKKGELHDRLELPWRPFLGIERPGILEVDNAGNLFVTDRKDQRIHWLPARTEYQHYYGAELKYRPSKFQEALKLYEKVLNVNPQNQSASSRITSILQTRSEKQLSAKEYDKALKTLNQILSLQPSDRSALTMKRIVLWNRNRDWIENLGLCLLCILFLGIFVSTMLQRHKTQKPKEAA